jgi:hypothetical protein
MHKDSSVTEEEKTKGAQNEPLFDINGLTS